MEAYYNILRVLAKAVAEVLWGLIILRVVQRLVTFGAFNVFVFLANLIDFLPFLSFAFQN
jgi:hypothetical protein